MISASGCHFGIQHVIKEEIKVSMNMKFNSKNKIYVQFKFTDHMHSGDQWKKYVGISIEKYESREGSFEIRDSKYGIRNTRFEIRNSRFNI